MWRRPRAPSASAPQGKLRIDVNGLLARTFLLPSLPDFLERYPLIELHIGEGDRLVDLVREGVDCVIRAGEPADSSMIVRRIGTLDEVTCASPAYLARHGVPRTPDELAGHRMIGFVSSRSREVMPLEFMVEGRLRTVTLPSRVTANSADMMADLARLGLGLIQAPRYRFAPDFAAGRLVKVLAPYPPAPMPLSLLYPQNRHLAPRVRVFLDWVTGLFAAAEP